MRLIILCFLILSSNFCAASDLYDDLLPPKNKTINYGYNPIGEYVPLEIGNDEINYGYNAQGDFVPMSVGGQKIRYGYNAYGEFVPMGIGE